ncbi:MAG: GNAT family N-acetyltransferase [Mesorhizobium sp.]|nr:MAG: GNAT family N-acetyltransferase [Mesorhizobium sp.]
MRDYDCPKGRSIVHATLKTLSHFDRARVAHLKLEPEQERFVDPLDLVFSELQANARPDLEHPFSIVVRHQTVGFFVLREKAALPEWAPSGVITLHSFRVGREYQGNGYGKAVTGLASKWVSTNRPCVSRLMLTVEEDNAMARRVYLKSGFSDTGATYFDKFGMQNILEYEIDFTGLRS